LTSPLGTAEAARLARTALALADQLKPMTPLQKTRLALEIARNRAIDEAEIASREAVEKARIAQDKQIAFERIASEEARSGRTSMGT